MLGKVAEAGFAAARFWPSNHKGRPTQAFALPAFAAQIAAAERGDREPVMRVGIRDARQDFPDGRDVVEAHCLP